MASLTRLSPPGSAAPGAAAPARDRRAWRRPRPAARRSRRARTRRPAACRDERVHDEPDRDRRGEHQPDGQETDRPQVVAEADERAVQRGRVEQRRQDQRRTRSGSSVYSGWAETNDIARPPEPAARARRPGGAATDRRGPPRSPAGRGCTGQPHYVHPRITLRPACSLAGRLPVRARPAGGRPAGRAARHNGCERRTPRDERKAPVIDCEHLTAGGHAEYREQDGCPECRLTGTNWVHLQIPDLRKRRLV